MDQTFDFLCNHRHAAALLARWHYNEWKSLYKNWTLETAFHDLAGHGSGHHHHVQNPRIVFIAKRK